MWKYLWLVFEIRNMKISRIDFAIVVFLSINVNNIFLYDRAYYKQTIFIVKVVLL